MELIIETGLYPPRVMLEVVQHYLYANFFYKLIKGVVNSTGIYGERFTVTVRQLNRWRIDPPFTFLPSLCPFFLYLSPFSPSLLYILSFVMPHFLRYRCGRDRMVFGLTNYLSNQRLSPLTLYLIQHYVTKLSVTCDISVVFSEYSGFLH